MCTCFCVFFEVIDWGDSGFLCTVNILSQNQTTHWEEEDRIVKNIEEVELHH